MSGKYRNSALVALVLVCMACGGGGASSNIAPFTAEVHGTVIATGLTQPMLYIACPDDARLAYVLEKPGTIRLLDNDVLQPNPVLDISSQVFTTGECGLSGMAFDPLYDVNRFVYLHYNIGPPIQGAIVRYTMNAAGTSLSDPQTVILMDHPTAGHKGGSINFGKDGMLYLATGDGGVGENADNSAQDGQSLLGKLLRIDIRQDGFPGDPNKNYSIPSNNPYRTSTTVLPEIWCVGFRNPFRWSVDASSGAFIIADVGQDFWEELNYLPAGASNRNFGWRVREGAHTFMDNLPAFSNTFTDPFFENDHTLGRAIIGGFIYRGAALDPSFRGRYIFADATIPKILSIPFSISGGKPRNVSQAEAIDHSFAINTSLDLDAITAPVSVSPDVNGEVIVCELYKGLIIRLVP